MNALPRYALIVSLFNGFFAGSAFAQSTELDRPTRLTSREVTVRVGAPTTHYFAFDVGPGDFTILFAARLDGGIYSGGAISCDLYDGDLNKLSLYVKCPNFGINTESQERTTITAQQKGTVVLAVTVLTLAEARTANARYRLRLGGAVNIDETAGPLALPGR